MNIKICSLVVLRMLQYASAMDARNCSNSTGPIFVGTNENPEMKFYIFTRNNFYEGQQIFAWNKTSLINSNFNHLHPTRILVHGYKSNYFSCFNGYVKDAYLNRGDFNVFVVDWGDWAHHINYFHVADSIFKFFGDMLADFTKFLNSYGNVPFDDMYLIGHSLGAQMSGAAGQSIKPDQYNTIFALDPAGPYFYTEEDHFSLDSSDAKYVEQISTNMGAFGYSGIVGHAAFYPNYGRQQKYCLLNDFERISCSHSAAYWYFAESINRKTEFCGQECPLDVIDDYTHLLFQSCPAIKCTEKNNKVLMGGEPSIPKDGTYYISVNYSPPFATCDCE